MDPKRINTKINVKQCSLCQGETEYHCHSCHKDLCQHCKATHVIDLETMDHEVTIYREKFQYLQKREICVMHPKRIYNKYCDPCEIPMCGACVQHEPKRSPLLACFYPREDNNHKVLGIRAAYKMKRQQQKKIIHVLRSETLYKSRILLRRLKSDVNTDVETCHKEINQGQSEMTKMGQILTYLSDSVLIEVIHIEDAKFKALFLKQKNRMTQCITRIQYYEHMYEQLAYRPVEFLRFIKNARLPRIQDTPHLTQHCRLSLTQEINMEDLTELLCEIQITERGKRYPQPGNELLLTLMPSPVLQKSLTVKGVNGCHHISCVSPDQIWVSDNEYINRLIWANTNGVKLFSVQDSIYVPTIPSGLHTVNREHELIYIDEEYNIKKLSYDLKTTNIFINKPNSQWEPRCVYCSPSTGDILVGMHRNDTFTGEVRRYNNTAKHTQTIPHKNTPHTLYKYPHYITENTNGDIVVSDYYELYRGGVVVTERGGSHRFTYTGPSSQSRLSPYGICTDALSNILVCDVHTETVHMLSKDGEFLSYLLTRESPGINDAPLSLSYDVSTNILWVGSGNYTSTHCERSTIQLSVYAHINRHLDITDRPTSYVNLSKQPSSSSERQAIQKNNLLQLCHLKKGSSTFHPLTFSVPTITEHDAREALLNYVSQNCCYGKDAADDLMFTDLNSTGAFHYTLESFVESRSKSMDYEPYKGQVIGDRRNWTDTELWDIEATPPSMFQDHVETFEVPNTAIVKSCDVCFSTGYVHCYMCLNGKVICRSCRGHGRVKYDSFKSWQCAVCNGDGRVQCHACDGHGKIVCRICDGQKKLKWYLKLTVEWKNHVNDHIVEGASLPDHLIRKVSGKIVFEDRNQKVWPITHFHNREINEASVRLIKSHQFPKTEDILMQRQRVRMVPVTHCSYKWKDTESDFFVYGFENHCYAPNYPQTCFCGCIIQ